MKRVIKLFALSVTLLVLIAIEGRAQSALDGFDPNANDIIRVVVVQPDGKILLGGDFTTLSPNGGGPVTRNRIARLNPDGTLDTAFNPNAVIANSDGLPTGVYAIAVQADGKILVGGNFSTIGGQTRNDIARLDATTGLADSFNPTANDLVLTIAVQADGKILAGGNFNGTNSIGGQTRNRIARLDATTGLADSFNPTANSGVNSIVVQEDGRILVGGQFSGANSIGGQTRNRIARLDATIGLADSFNPNASDILTSIAVQADGMILAGGFFTSIGGQTRNRIGRLDPTTGLADSFDPNANGQVNSIVVQADGQILAAGLFSSIGGETRQKIARLDAATGLADSFDPNANNEVFSIAVQADGKILAAGDLTFIGGQTRNRIARLETDGTLDQTLDLNIVCRPLGGRPLSIGSFVFATAVQSDGKILFGGKFTSVLGVNRSNIARLNTNGTLDTTFDPNANSPVNVIAVQVDGKILAGGLFTSIGGETRNYIARLDADGSADSFDPNANSEVDSIATQPDGGILVGGNFSGANSIGGQTRNYIARLDPTTGLADSFDPNANGRVHSVAVQTDGKILAGGLFSGANSIGGQTRNRIARLNATTGLADSFDPNANNEVDTIATQPDGRILVGGNFSGANGIGGETRNYIARLDGTTGLADSFDPDADSAVRTIVVQADGKVLAGGLFTSIHGETRNGIARLEATTGLADSFDPNANGEVDSIATQPDGKILVGGQFDSIDGQTRVLFARLSNDAAALQNLAVTQTAVTWSRGGSSPQLTRVTFEYSDDHVNYTPLGNGIPQGGSSNWILTGLNLPIEQNIYIRARGYYGGGLHSSSESITESVRNAFITLSISGTISYCSNPSLNPVPSVTLTLSGDRSGSTLSNGSGNYTLSSVPSGGSYTVTPTKAALTSGSAGINTVDVIAVQGQALSRPPGLTGCRLTAANVNGDNSVNTQDVIAVQAFALGRTSGFANTGKYQFNPPNRTYSGMVSNQTAQNYDTLVLGDVASSFVHRPEGGGDMSVSTLSRLNTSADELPATVAAVTLPEVAVDELPTPNSESLRERGDLASGSLSRERSRSNFIAAVRTSTIDAKNKLVGFQGDFTFDERVVTFQGEPVRKAGITSGNWNVSGNVLPGAGPIRTLRVSAFSNNFTPLSGSGTLFELTMTRVSKAAQGTQLFWAAPPNDFIFIDTDLKTQKPATASPSKGGPGNAAPGSVILSGGNEKNGN
jgi:uncharacterized delta-60 repeat protein